MDEAVFWIYGLRCTCHPDHGVRYVGQTGKGISTRLYNHKWRAANPERGKGYRHKVYNWMRKHGIDNIYATELDTCAGQVEANLLEEKRISEMGTFGTRMGLNLNAGGGGNSGWKQTPESIQKMRDNRVYSEDALRRIGEAASERLKNPDLQAKMQKARREATAARGGPKKAPPKTKRGTPEHSEMLRKRATGKTPSLETRVNMSAGQNTTGFTPPLLLEREEVEGIVEMLNDNSVPTRDIREKYNVTANTLYEIRQSKVWSDVPRPWGSNPPKRFMTESEAAEVITALSGGESFAEIQKKFGISRSATEKIKYGKSFKNLERPWKK